jgi:F-type H+-transporting ATPase subunit epsilon
MALQVHLVTPEREVWSGDADLIVARGTDGDVGILSGHTPLLIELAIGPLKIVRQDGEEYAVVDGGFMHVSSYAGSTRVDVLASHAELAGEVDVAAARHRAEEFEARLREEDNAEARAELAKAMARASLGR